MIGGVDWSKRQFNTAVKTQVQPGSTAKLPLIVAACEAGKKPGSRVLDVPLTESWPSNGVLGYKGETTLGEAIASSRNAAAVRLAQEIGPRKVADVSRRLGIEPGANPDLSFVLGSFSASVLGMTAAYAAVANGGYRVTPTGVLAVVDGRGHVRANFVEQSRVRVIAENCVQSTRTVLNEVVRSGTGSGARLRRWQAYGKTGTTTGNADAWFVGWSEGRVLGVWMGKRRDAVGEAIGGKGAPAEFFRLVSNGTNEMMDYRAGQGRRASESRVAEARSERPTPAPQPPVRKLAAIDDSPARPAMSAARRFAPEAYYPDLFEEDPWYEEEEEPLGRW
jgi:penicillin-binding protein 1A